MLFESIAELVFEDQAAEMVVCGADVNRYAEYIHEAVDGGFTDTGIVQIGENQDELIRFHKEKVYRTLASGSHATNVRQVDGIESDQGPAG